MAQQEQRATVSTADVSTHRILPQNELILKTCGLLTSYVFFSLLFLVSVPVLIC